MLRWQDSGHKSERFKPRLSQEKVKKISSCFGFISFEPMSSTSKCMTYLALNKQVTSSYEYFGSPILIRNLPTSWSSKNFSCSTLCGYLLQHTRFSPTAGLQSFARMITSLNYFETLHLFLNALILNALIPDNDDSPNVVLPTPEWMVPSPLRRAIRPGYTPSGSEHRIHIWE